ncbi:MAG TPA: SDR family NAD(P)-dependent oxidoreductase [Solirubrobacteraceae bacterium]|nr:SDR family NAD(P)-dependent oxidoreductase [Solirubrobacteraceae bacterium]
MNVAGKRVLLTGATGGLGHAIARRLAAAGAHVILSGRRGDVLVALAGEIGAEIAPADLSDSKAVHELAETHAEIDVLVANAGLPASGRLSTYTPEQIERALVVNLHAPIMLAHAITPAMVQRGSGHIVFMSSLAGKTATAGSSIYNATKFGLRGFAGALRAELHGTGVGVSTIFPGFIRDAGMFADANVKLPFGVGTKTPEQVAEATLRAIERNRGEIDVAPVGLKLGSLFGGIAPELAATVTRKSGGAQVADKFERGQLDKR